MAGDPDVIDYDTNATITYPAVIKIGGKKFMDFYQEISSPSIRAIHIELENGADNVLSILTGTHESEEIELPALKEFVLTVTMDTSGIYNVHYHKPSVNKSTLENLYLQADNYIKKKSLDYFIPQVMQTNCVDVVGIDFGASKCCVAVNRNSGMETIPLDNTGERNLPSYIAFEEKHNKCGKIVINRLWYCEKSAVFDTKLIIGKKYDEVKHDGSWPFKLIKMNNNPALLKDNHFRPQDYYTMIQFQGYEGEALKYPEEISSILLKYIKEKAEEFQGKKLSEAVLQISRIDVDEFDPSKEGHLTITRQDFENLATELLEGIKTTILETLEKSGYKTALYAYDTNNKRTEIMIAADNRGHFVNQERSDLKTITTDVSLDTEEPFQHCVNQKYEKFKSEKSEHSVIDLSDDKTVKSDIKSLKSNITIK
uniref:Heat shock protein 70 n=1 Tax=Panagrolaimus superbus TaxID=310955 RepID=A0A914Z9E8_9BILA